MNQPSHEEVLAVSSGWVAVVLNVIPGLGAGYLYQRRWRAWWITSFLSAVWFTAGFLFSDVDSASGVDVSVGSTNQLVGLIGLLTLALVTATDAGLTVRRVRARLI